MKDTRTHAVAKWPKKSDDWFERTKLALGKISATKREWFMVLDTVPAPRHKTLVTDPRFLNKYAMHDYRLMRLERILDEAVKEH